MKNLKLTIFLLAVLTACGGEKTQNPPVDNGAPAPAPSNPILPVPIIPSNVPPNVITPTYRQDVPVAVMDSGVDVSHPTLAPLTWKNARETANNKIDDDKNAYIDDTVGWSFIDNNNVTFDAKTVAAAPVDIVRFMHFGALLNAATPLSIEDAAWYNQHVSDVNYTNSVPTYSTAAHGTHVSGIIVKENPHARIMSLKILATGSLENSNVNLAKFFLRNIAGIGGSSTGIGDAVRYASQQGALVANGSFSLGIEDIRQAIAQTNVPAYVNSLVSFAFSQIASTLSTEISRANNTLFIFAAGNDAADNDTTQRLPANVRQVNALTVAATKGRTALAAFSNYGATHVDIAAPGVDIVSTVPGNQTVEMSGTSMAAPYVARVASQVRSINPKLGAIETRRILMETVDVKEFLRGKVISSGIVNPARAQMAAELTNTMAIDVAIAQARQMVADALSD